MDKTYNILLVDDEPGVRESVQAYLDDDENLSVTAAENATKALELLQTFTPDLVISDIMMPQMSGYDFLEKLREDPRFKTLPVVFLTARGMTSDRIQGYQAGCDAYLPKPFEPEELEAIVKNLLTKEEAIAETQSGGDANLDGIAQDLKEIKQFLGQQNQLVTTPPPLKIDLTPREQSVLDLVAQGLMNKEIAKQLETSVRNVEKYVSRLFGKTGTNSRTELVRYALKHGLTQ
ncbi:response regulator transcription factor [[Limnothrix rosea] IAM M-220]|uniref:response regulator transcription factor n=1 Tax=[Limnothrix rosea] IAM M-220 TaxID=454133 RepID=UPI00096579F2|nr:response regulator transcription factor [[Limnothrix rosea] IAM M-220]OKH14207.1 DNA-binding response regulator [[Limnothrix rosea] IAM M-220]